MSQNIKSIQFSKYFIVLAGALLIWGMFFSTPPKAVFAVPPTSTTTSIVCHMDNRAGYFWGFGGGSMVDFRSKLTNTANFGAGGNHPTAITLYANWNASGTITQASLDAAGCNVFVLGGEYDTHVTAAEMSELYNWAQDCNGYIVKLNYHQSWDTLMGTIGYPSTWTGAIQPHNMVVGHPVSTNVFGTITTVAMSYTRAYTANTAGATVIATDSLGRATILELDGQNILAVQNFVNFRPGYAGSVSAGNGVINDSDILAMNVFAHAIDSTNECATIVTVNKTLTTVFRDGVDIGTTGPFYTGDVICYDLAYEGTGTVYDFYNPAKFGFIDTQTYDSDNPDIGPYLQDVNGDTIDEEVLEYNVSSTGSLTVYLEVQ